MSNNIIIRNVEFRWAKLDPAKPVSPFGSPVWELSVHVPTDAVTPEFASLGVVKSGGDGTSYVLLKKRADKADGSPAQPVSVIDKDKKDLDATRIGNGSRGAVKVFQRDYNYNGKTGVSNVLMAVMVTDLVEYVKPTSLDAFDAAEDMPEVATPVRSMADLMDDY